MKPSVENRKRILNDFFKVDEYTVRLPSADGTLRPARRQLVFERGDAVAALLFHRSRQKYILGRQFRFPASTKADGWFLEVFAGVIDRGETPLEAAYREILEESGFRAGELQPIADFFPSPGGSSERIYLYYGEVDESDRLQEGGGLAEEGEQIVIEELSLDELRELVRTGQVRDAKTLIALHWLFARRENR